MTFLLAQEVDEAARIILPKLDELIWGAIAFTVFFVVVAYIAWLALKKALKEREQGIRGELERAEQARVDADEAREELRRQLADARSQADQIVREAQTTAEEVKRDIIARAEQEAAAVVQKAREDASQEADRVFSGMRQQMAELSLELATRVVEKELADPQGQRELVDSFISQVGAFGSGRGNQN